MKITASLIESKDDSDADLQLSVSKVKTFDTCKAKYKYQYIEKLPKKEWDFHVFGKFLHDSLESFHKKLISNSSIDYRELMNDCFQQSIKTYSPTKEQKNDAFKILAIYLQKLYKQKNNNTLPNITGIEKPFFIDINSKILINGYIDRVQIDHDGILHVADYKTTKNKKYLKDFFQLETYAYALFLDNPSLDKIRASYIMLRHKCEHLVKEYNRSDIDLIADKFVEYAKNIEEEKIWRAQPQFLCKYCDFLEHCGAGQKFLTKKGILQIENKNETYGLLRW